MRSLGCEHRQKTDSSADFSIQMPAELCVQTVNSFAFPCFISSLSSAKSYKRRIECYCILGTSLNLIYDSRNSEKNVVLNCTSYSIK